MSDENNAAPNGAGDGAVQTSDTPAPAQVTEAPAKSAREAVERAMSKAAPTEPSQKPEPTATEAKPEAKVDATGRVHGPDGKFAPKEGEKEPEPKPKRPPPVRFAKDAHPHWETTPEPVQAEVERALTELTQGIEKYKPGHEAYEQLKPVAQLIKDYQPYFDRYGTTPAQSFHALLQAKQLLDTNPMNGFISIGASYGIDFRPFFQWLSQQRGLPQPQRPQVRQQPQRDIGAIVEEKLQEREISQEIKRFGNEKPFFELLRPTMSQLLDGGEAQTLDAAYDAALSRHPELKAASEAQAAAKAAQDELDKLKGQGKPDLAQNEEKARLSITGSPNSGSNPSNRKPSGSARESVERAFAQVGLR